jgi:hypothetical protein
MDHNPDLDENRGSVPPMGGAETPHMVAILNLRKIFSERGTTCRTV